MYAVVVVDDEPVAADGICDVLEQLDDVPFHISRFYSGARARDHVRGNKVDVLVTDLVMPDVDGWDLQREARAHWPGCKVIFLTGHSDVQKIQTAMRERAVDYVLKSEDDDRLVAAVRRSLDDLEAEASERVFVREAQGIREQATPLLRRALLVDLIDGWVADEREFASAAKRAELLLDPHESVALVLARIDDYGSIATRQQRAESLIVLEQSFRQFLPHAVVQGVSYDPSLIAWFVQQADHTRDYDGLRTRRFVRYVHDNLDVFQRLSRDRLGIQLSLALGSELVSVSEIPHVFAALREKLRTIYRFETEVIISDVGLPATPPSSEGPDSNPNGVRSNLKRISEIELVLDSGDLAACDELLAEARRLATTASDMKPSVKIEMAVTLAGSLVSYMNRRGLFDAVAAQTNVSRLLAVDRELDDLFDAARETCEVVITLNEHDSQDMGSRIVSHAQSYIVAHLDDDLSLSAIAERYGFNASYFSRLFKRHAGMNLTEYVAAERMRLARELLRDSSLRIKEIADRTGFRTVSYFIAVFKRFTGSTPQQFRSGTPE